MRLDRWGIGKVSTCKQEGGCVEGGLRGLSLNNMERFKKKAENGQDTIHMVGSMQRDVGLCTTGRVP